MQDNQQYINSSQCPPSTSSVGIKAEVSSDPTALCLLSPPSSPSFSQSFPTRPASSPGSENTRRAYFTAIPSTKRARRPSSRESHYLDPPGPKEGKKSIMAQPPYHSWPASGVKSEDLQGAQLGSSPSTSRRASSDSEEHQYASYPAHYPETYLRHPIHTTDARPHSSSSTLTTSSLTGAMGDAHISSHTSGSSSPPAFAYHSDPATQNMMWAQGPDYTMTDPAGSMPFLPSATHTSNSPTESYLQYEQPQYTMQNYSNISPSSNSPDSPGFLSGRVGQIGYSQPSRVVAAPGAYPVSAPSMMQPTASRAPSREQVLEAEIRRLRARVQDLEYANSQLMAGTSAAKGPSYGQQFQSVLGQLPSPVTTPVRSAAFQAEWKARTEARVRIFCSLNRAGNALCAWHDSRRERRTYPPRMAPAGYLNCGCTYEEALFEESLARHGVGSYHPGESVRMDPALRNPLLKLLERRYGYRDGDFERDPITGNWIEGEGAKPWEEKVMAGVSASRRRPDERR